jgi:sialate O-acetylesterase
MLHCKTIFVRGQIKKYSVFRTKKTCIKDAFEYDTKSLFASTMNGRNTMRRWVIAVTLVLTGGFVRADVKLPAIFSDNMVLQQKSAVAVWGQADVGEKIEVLGSWMKSPATTKTDKKGKWQIEIKTPKAGGPYTLTVKGNNTITLQNVLVGEVWICSGQSNIELPVKAVDNAEHEIQTADFPAIRLFTVKHTSSLTPEQDCVGQWKVCTPETIDTFSAVGYLFGREIHQKLNVPVGLISTNWGGTPAEAWASEKALKPFKDYDSIIKRMQNPPSVSEETLAQNEKVIAKWEEEIAQIDPGTKENWQNPKMDVSDWKEMELPRPWSRTELEKIDGIVWFRRVTMLPPSWARADMELYLGPIDDADTTWVNGVKIGSTTAYDQERKYIIPQSALRVGPNVIAVRVFDNYLEGGFTGTEDQMRIGPVGTDIKTCATIAGSWKYKVSLADKPLPALPKVSGDRFNKNAPTTLYNGMIAPLIPFRIAGAIWYQGESNVERPAEYAKLFPAMIADWRKQWDIGDFPFYWVQIAPYQYSNPQASESAYLREAQMKSLKTVKNGGIAVTMDIGAKDNIHPTDKQNVGKRLALWALAKTYKQKDIACSGPIYKSMRVEGLKIRLYFDYTHGGLSATDGHLTDFVIAGADKKFVPAEAVIDGDTVVVSSPQVQKPVAVRYAWSNWARGSLFNKEKLPASSFRTDEWDDNPDKPVSLSAYQN